MASYRRSGFAIISHFVLSEPSWFIYSPMSKKYIRDFANLQSRATLAMSDTRVIVRLDNATLPAIETLKTRKISLAKLQRN